MILHQITKYHPPQSNPKKPQHISTILKNKYKGVHGTDDHKKFILERAVRDCKFEKGETVLYKRNTWKITDIYGLDDFRYVSWDGLSPCFVEIMDDYGEIQLVNSGMLKRRR